jgi:hypothetical protein
MAHNAGMNTTRNLRKGDIRRGIESASASLNHAANLLDMLKAHPLTGNPYYDDAVERAAQLVAEMDEDQSYWFEQAMESGFGPEDFS